MYIYVWSFCFVCCVIVHKFRCRVNGLKKLSYSVFEFVNVGGVVRNTAGNFECSNIRGRVKQRK